MTRSRWISDLHWVRTGQQSRSQRTQEALLEAAATLFAEKGVDATSVADVAREAGFSVGSVYHHFRDKQTLLYAIVERYSEEHRATARHALEPARWEGATVSDILRGYVEFGLELGRERPAPKGACLEAAKTEPKVRAHLADLHAEVHDGIAALLLARREEIGHADPELSVHFVVEQIAALLERRLHPQGAPSALDHATDDRFTEEIMRSVERYLAIRA